MTNRKPSANQARMLQLVADGHVQYGAEYPERARRFAARGQHDVAHAFVGGGVAAYGREITAWGQLEERGWIVARIDLLPTRRVPAEVRTRVSITGFKEEYELPEHDEPEDPGWRAAVELTDAGRAVLARAGSR